MPAEKSSYYSCCARARVLDPKGLVLLEINGRVWGTMYDYVPTIILLALNSNISLRVTLKRVPWMERFGWIFLSFPFLFFPRAVFFVLLLRDPLRDFVNKIRRNRRGKCGMKTFLIHLLSFSKSSQSYQEKEGSFLIQKNRTIGFFFFFLMQSQYIWDIKWKSFRLISRRLTISLIRHTRW